MALAYAGFAVRDIIIGGEKVGIIIREQVTFDGTLSVWNFPSTANGRNLAPALRKDGYELVSLTFYSSETNQYRPTFYLAYDEDNAMNIYFGGIDAQTNISGTYFLTTPLPVPCPQSSGIIMNIDAFKLPTNTATCTVYAYLRKVKK